MTQTHASRSYAAHARLEEQQADASRMTACFTASDTVVAWRHRRMHEMLNPLLEFSPMPVLGEIFGFQNIIAIPSTHPYLNAKT